MNIRDVLRQLGVRFWEQGESTLVTADWVGIICSRCGQGTGKPGLGINLRTLRCSCWRCGGVSIGNALAEASGRRVGEILALLGDLTPQREEVRLQGKLVLPEGVGPLLPAHRKYLIGRGFDPDEVAEKWGIQGIGATGTPLQWRLFLPITDELGKVVSWTTRAIGDVPHGNRYRGAKREESAIPRGEILYGANHARHAVIAVEGPFGAIWGGLGFVCTCGVGFSRTQVALLSKYPIRVICFDAEPVAQRRARVLANQLAVFPGETHVIQTSGADPDTSPLSERDEIRERFLS